MSIMPNKPKLMDVVNEHDLLVSPVLVKGQVIPGSLYVQDVRGDRLPTILWRCADYYVSASVSGYAVYMGKRG